MMWAVRDGDGWRRVGPRQFEVGGSVYPGRVLTEWDAERLAGIGVHPVTEATPPEGQQAAGPSLLRDVDGAPVWGPAAWEDVPPPGVPSLTRLQFWGLVRALDAQGLAMGARLDAAASADPDVRLALDHAVTFDWPRFEALATATGAEPAELNIMRTVWRAAAEGGA